jgi:hypothetical protein
VALEFKAALIAAGLNLHRGQTAASKYPRVIKMLFDDGIFTTRAQLFAAGAEMRAWYHFSRVAQIKAETGRVSARKHFTNMRSAWERMQELLA